MTGNVLRWLASSSLRKMEWNFVKMDGVVGVKTGTATRQCDASSVGLERCAAGSEVVTLPITTHAEPLPPPSLQLHALTGTAIECSVCRWKSPGRETVWVGAVRGVVACCQFLPSGLIAWRAVVNEGQRGCCTAGGSLLVLRCVWGKLP